MYKLNNKIFQIKFSWNDSTENKIIFQYKSIFPTCNKFMLQKNL